MLFALALAAPAQDDTKKDPPAKDDKPATVADQAKAIEKEFNEKRQELFKKIRAAKEDEREPLFKELNELQAEAGKKLIDLARKDPKDAGSLAALKTVLIVARNDNKIAGEVLKMLTEHHVLTAGVGELAAGMMYGDNPETKAFLSAVVEKNPKKDDQAKALFVLGFIAKRKAGEDGVKDADREKAVAEATKAFETLKEKYADVKVMGNQAAGNAVERFLIGLKNLPNLVVGKQAPEIVGDDLDGKPFKLSDYRGKVVFLDFWAHW